MKGKIAFGGCIIAASKGGGGNSRAQPFLEHEPLAHPVSCLFVGFASLIHSLTSGKKAVLTNSVCAVGLVSPSRSSSELQVLTPALIGIMQPYQRGVQRGNSLKKDWVVDNSVARFYFDGKRFVNPGPSPGNGGELETTLSLVIQNLAR